MAELPDALREALDAPAPLFNPAHRVPYPEDQFRAQPSAAAQLEDDAKLLEEILGRKPKKGAELRPSRRMSGGGAAPPPELDAGASAAVLTRLSKLEVAYKRLRDEMVGKERELLRLRRDNGRLEQAVAAHEDSAAAAEQLEVLCDENYQLRQQVADMEKFLNDYGLVWVGAGSREAEAEAEAEAAADASAAPDLPLLLRKLHELNELVGGDEPQIQRSQRGAQFVHQKGVRLAVYRNGLMLRAGPFRHFHTEATQKFVRDVCDGYFPSEFKESHPDGLLFDVADKTGQEYVEPFAGAGAGRAVNAVSGLASMGDAELPLSRKDFLARLPPSVVGANGQLHSVREEVGQMLGGGGPRDTIVVETEALRTSTSAAAGAPSDAAEGQGDRRVTTLQVRSGDGSQTLMLKMFFGDTVGQLRAALDEQRTSAAPYELRTAFPNRVYEDAQQTLSECGLVPNATLLMRACAAPPAAGPVGLALAGELVLPGAPLPTSPHAPRSQSDT